MHEELHIFAKASKSIAIEQPNIAQIKFSWVIIQPRFRNIYSDINNLFFLLPFGSPVLPLVNMIRDVSLGFGKTKSTKLFRPISLNVLYVNSLRFFSSANFINSGVGSINVTIILNANVSSFQSIKLRTRVRSSANINSTSVCFIIY